MSVYLFVPTSQRSSARIATATSLLILLSATALRAQVDDSRWQMSGEAGGMLGGRWLAGDNAPSIKSGAGAELSLRVARGLRPRVDGGVAIRVAAQSLQLTENGVQWSGPTLTSGSLVAISSVGLAHTASWSSAVDVGAGATFLSGARTIFPFSTAARIAPTLEAGFSLRHLPEVGARSRRSLIGQTGFFARYELTRVDPGAAPVGGGGAVGITGWTGRVAFGLRVDR